MEQNKEEVIGELYALRGGLSIVSLKIDSILANDHKCDVINSEIIQADNKIKRIRGEIQRNEELLCKENQEYHKTIEKKDELHRRLDYELKNRIKKEKEHYEEYSNPNKAHSIMVVLRVILFISLFLLVPALIVGMVQYLAFEMYAGFIVCIVSGLLLGVIIASNIIMPILVHQKYKRNALDEIDRDLRNYERRIDDYENKIEQYSTTIERLHQEEQDATNDKERIIQLCRNQTAEIDKQSNYISEVALIYNDALEKVYGKQLNPLDWGNLDLVIYFLQTGRADSIKESLQLVDRQKQTNKIVCAIEHASDKICGEIRSGFTMLGKTMVTCFNSLSNQINALGTQLSNQHTGHINALQKLVQQNDEIISAMQLSSALQAKANVTSEQLIKDVQFIKDRIKR